MTKDNTVLIIIKYNRLKYLNTLSKRQDLMRQSINKAPIVCEDPKNINKTKENNKICVDS